MTRTVTLCSSGRFYDQARTVATRLSGESLEVLTPRFDFSETEVVVDEETKAGLTHEFLAKVSKSDLIYVISINGYVGISVAMEIGYATALGLPVVLCEQAQEDAIKALTTRIVDIEGVSAEMLFPDD